MRPFDQNDQERWFVDEVLPHETDLRSWLRARFPAAGDIDDLVQDSYSKLLRARRTGNIANPKAYLFTVARNLALNQIRHLQYERPEGSEEIDPLTIAAEVNSPLDSIQHKEDLEKLVAAIQSLPERCRQVLTLRKIYGLSQKEIAIRLEISVSTVEAQITIGLRKCNQYFFRGTKIATDFSK